MKGDHSLIIHFKHIVVYYFITYTSITSGTNTDICYTYNTPTCVELQVYIVHMYYKCRTCVLYIYLLHMYYATHVIHILLNI